MSLNLKSQSEKAEYFRSLHHAPGVLFLPNAWDVPTARLFESVGFKVVATTSAGMMVSLGYEDGERVPFSEFLGVVLRARNGQFSVSKLAPRKWVDLGSRPTPEQIAERWNEIVAE